MPPLREFHPGSERGLSFESVLLETSSLFGQGANGTVVFADSFWTR